MFPECEQSTSSCEIKLRELEIDSYSKILSVFRARGNLTNERRKLLKQIGSFLNISQERHRAEVRRVTNDELLSTIASRLTGHDWTVDWHEEGKRLIPTPTPFSHYTVNTPFADYIASVASLGKKYVDLYNKRVCDSVPNEEKTSELKVSCGHSKQQWLSDVNQVFTIVQKDKLRDVSVQTIKKKVIPKKCTYCERRKELRKKRLEEKETKKNEDSSSENENKKGGQNEKNILLPSGKHIIVENAFHDLAGDLSVSVIAQEVIVETEPIAGPSHSCDIPVESLGSFSSIPPVSCTLATPDFSGLNMDSSKLHAKDYLDPTFSNAWEDLEKPPPPRIPRILNSGPRKKVRKQILHPAPVKYSSPGDRGLRKKIIETSRDLFSGDNSTRPVGTSQVQVKYSKPAQIPLSSRQGPSKYHTTSNIRPTDIASKQPETHSKFTRQTEISSKQVGVLRHHDVSPKHHEEITKQRETIPKHREVISKQHEVLLKHNEGLSKYPEVVPKHIDSSSKPSGGIYKHYVRVRHTPKASKPFSEVSKHYSDIQSPAHNFSDTIEIPIEYLHSERSESFEAPMEVVEINDYRIASGDFSHNLSENQRELETVSVENIDHVFHDNSCDQHITSINFLTSSESSDNIVEEIIVPTAQASSQNNSEGKKVNPKDETPSRKVIKIYNGEKKVHRTIHFRAENMKDLINKLPNAQFSQVDVNNGCQADEESTTILQNHSVWDGANISGGEFIMEDVSIVDESSYPIVNGHEEIILEEEVFSGSQIIESLVDKSDVCVIPQADMKFSVVNLTDYTGSIESIHSVSSQSKDDSRDSDIVMNRP